MTGTCASHIDANGVISIRFHLFILSQKWTWGVVNIVGVDESTAVVAVDLVVDVVDDIVVCVCCGYCWC